MRLLRVGATGREIPAVLGPDGDALDLSRLTSGTFLAVDGGVQGLRLRPR